MEPEWNRSGTGVEPEWNRSGTGAEPEWNRSRTGAEPERNRNGTGVEPEWNRSGTGVEPEQNSAHNQNSLEYETGGGVIYNIKTIYNRDCRTLHNEMHRKQIAGRSIEYSVQETKHRHQTHGYTPKCGIDEHHNGLYNREAKTNLMAEGKPQIKQKV